MLQAPTTFCPESKESSRDTGTQRQLFLHSVPPLCLQWQCPYTHQPSKMPHVGHTTATEHSCQHHPILPEDITFSKETNKDAESSSHRKAINTSKFSDSLLGSFCRDHLVLKNTCTNMIKSVIMTLQPIAQASNTLLTSHMGCGWSHPVAH